MRVELPVNTFKRALHSGTRQIGLWMGLADPFAAEMLAGAGFDWLCIDGEHSPNNVRTVLAQLQAAAAYPVHCVVRPVNAGADLIKRYLDVGVQTLVLPMIETPEEAARVVAATRYPTRGHRGVASATTRASRWGRVDRYFERAEAELCVIVQVESVRGLENLAAIAEVEGIDGVFFGPADLAASMGLIGKAADPRVQTAITEGIKTVLRAGKAVGTLTGERERAREYLALGAGFVAVGIDMALLAKAASDLAAEFKEGRGA
jgi:4-hydroxy-2-oxoheptanedioate aldolase